MSFEHKTLFIDCETSGLPPKRAVPGKRKGTTRQEVLPYEEYYNEYPLIISMAWKIDDNETNYYELNPEGREIPKEASDIHGITTEIANKSPYVFYQAILEMLNGEINCQDVEIVVGHGIYFDTSIIKANILREVEKGRLSKINFDDISEILHKYKRIDTIRKTAKMMGGWATLSALHMKIFQEGFKCHHAKNDVEAVYRCYQWLLSKGIVPTWDQLQEKAREKEENKG